MVISPIPTPRIRSFNHTRRIIHVSMIISPNHKEYYGRLTILGGGGGDGVFRAATRSSRVTDKMSAMDLTTMSGLERRVMEYSPVTQCPPATRKLSSTRGVAERARGPDERQVAGRAGFVTSTRSMRSTDKTHAMGLDEGQGLTLVHFSAQRQRFPWAKGCIQRLFRG